MITLISALDENNLIGSNNTLPWHLPEDLKHFKNTTINKTVVMGRNTCNSFPSPLPNRENLVLTTRPLTKKGFKKTTFDEVLELSKTKEIMVIGGATVYAQFLPLSSKMILTHIHSTFKGDTWFPKWNINDWSIKTKQVFKSNENKWNYTIIEYIRKTSHSE